MLLENLLESPPSLRQMYAPGSPVPGARAALDEPLSLEPVQHRGHCIRVRVSSLLQLLLAKVALLRQHREEDKLVGSHAELAEVRLGTPLKVQVCTPHQHAYERGKRHTTSGTILQLKTRSTASQFTTRSTGEERVTRW